jgi:hypothetical protein
VVHTCNPSTQEAEGAAGLRVQGQPELHSQTLSQKKKKMLTELKVYLSLSDRALFIACVRPWI